VTNEGSLGLAGGQVPKTHSLIPRTGKGETSIMGQANITDKVVVAAERLFGNTVVLAIGGEVPNDGRLV
jgi:hypothetical protein